MQRLISTLYNNLPTNYMAYIHLKFISMEFWFVHTMLYTHSLIGLKTAKTLCMRSAYLHLKFGCTPIPIVPKKYNRHWVSIAKEPFMKSEKSNRIMKLWLFPYNSVKTPSDLPSSHKEIWNFIKQVIGPFLPSFVTWMYVASTGRLCSQKTGLQTY